VDDDRIVKVLEEMRDLQRQHLAQYQEAVRNQQEAIAIQRQATRRVVRLAVLVVIFGLAVIVLIALPYLRR